MTKEVLHSGKHDTCRYTVTDAEAIRRIHECLVKTNPELKESDIYAWPPAHEYRAEYHRSDGEEVRMSIGIANLKRYFGALSLGFTNDGIRFTRNVKRKKA